MTPLDLSTLRTDAEEGVAPSAEASIRVTELARALVTLREEKRELEAELKELNARYDEIRKDSLPENMHAAGMVSANGKASISLSTGEKIHLQGDLHVSLPAVDQQAFFKILRKSGDGALIKETIHYQSLRAWVRERLSDGIEVPDMITVHSFLKAVIRGGGNK